MYTLFKSSRVGDFGVDGVVGVVGVVRPVGVVGASGVVDAEYRCLLKFSAEEKSICFGDSTKIGDVVKSCEINIFGKLPFAAVKLVVTSVEPSGVLNVDVTGVSFDKLSFKSSQENCFVVDVLELGVDTEVSVVGVVSGVVAVETTVLLGVLGVDGVEGESESDLAGELGSDESTSFCDVDATCAAASVSLVACFRSIASFDCSISDVEVVAFEAACNSFSFSKAFSASSIASVFMP